MCVLCYTPTQAVGEAIVFGGPFAMGWIKHQRAKLRRNGGEEVEPAVAEVVDEPSTPAPKQPLRPAPVADCA